jgi:hypothetical protein
VVGHGSGVSVVGFADSLDTSAMPTHGGILGVTEQPRHPRQRGVNWIRNRTGFFERSHQALPSWCDHQA